MKIKLLRLDIKNFKGIKEKTINFSNITDILGKNATGKSTIFDAFTWVLFGKDSKDRKDFDIKTIDGDGNVLHGLEHNVTAFISVDSFVMELSRTYKEKWVKERGKAHKELKSHTTEYFINGIPQSQKEFQDKINGIFSEDKFKLITNPLYFTNMKWQDQRKILFDIIGDISESDILASDNKFKALEDKIGHVSVEDFNKMTKAQIKKLKEKVADIPIRIDEVNNSIVDVDFDAVEFRKRNILGGIQSVDEQILDKSKANDNVLAMKNHLYNLKNEFQNKLNHAKTVYQQKEAKDYEKINNIILDIQNVKREIERLERRKADFNNSIAFEQNLIKDYEVEKEKLRELFKIEAAKVIVFDKDEFICPTCKREFEKDDIISKQHEMENNFKKHKKEVLNKIQVKGKELNIKINIAQQGIDKLKINLTDINKQINDINCKGVLLEQNKIDEEVILENKYNSIPVIDFEGKEQLKSEIQATEQDLAAFKLDSNVELFNKKSHLQQQLEAANNELNLKELNHQHKLRIIDLELEEKDLSESIANLEGQLFLGEEFARTKIELLESKVSEKFDNLVQFKLFDKQINGGISETCEALVDGVPFKSVNTAAQINVGLAIIKVLSQHYDAKAPVFIDNAESVNQFIKMDTQIVKLIVSEDLKLVVEGK